MAMATTNKLTVLVSTPGLVQRCRWRVRRSQRSVASRIGSPPPTRVRIAIAAYLGKGDAFDRAIADFSTAQRRPERKDFEAQLRPRPLPADRLRRGPGHPRSRCLSIVGHKSRQAFMFS
jgi:hypothetical protein